METIFIPENVQNIGSGLTLEGVFDGCSALKSITVDDCNKYFADIDGVLFSKDLSSLLTYPNAHGTEYIVPEYVTKIGVDAFCQCDGLHSVTIPGNVQMIGGYAFYACSGLASVIMSEGVTSISNNAFASCKSLEILTLPDSVTKIGLHAFIDTGYYDNPNNWESGLLYIGHHLIAGDAEQLPENVVIRPDTITIADYALSECDSLISVTIPDSVTIIGDEAFAYSSSLTSVFIGSSVTTISSNAFNNCISLNSITIPDSVTSIGGGAFGDCTSLTSITIPDSVTYIGGGAFHNTGYYNDPSHWKGGILYIGNHLVDSDVGELLPNVDICPGTLTIAGASFNLCESLESVTIPNSVVTIGEYAFNGCSSLTTITIGNHVTSIGTSAFDMCPSLTSVIIPDSVITIGNWAFERCASLASVTLGNRVTSIGYQAFRECDKLLSVTIPASVTEIGDEAFGYHVKDEVGWEPLPGFTVSGFTGTEAEEYANENGFAFIALDSTVDPFDAVDSDHIGGISAKEMLDFYQSVASGTQPIIADFTGDHITDIADVLWAYLLHSGQIPSA